MYSFISPAGETIKTKTIKQFADLHGFAYSHARNMACGYTMTMKGFCSTSPAARRKRKRFMTVLVNPSQGKREILGQSVTAFAGKHHLCTNEVYLLVNARKIGVRGWYLERTLQAAQEAIAAPNF